jgi:hypothetical protein
MVVDCRMFKGIPQGGATPIEVEIAIEIRKLPENDFDHDFDTYSERRWFENNNALSETAKRRTKQKNRYTRLG